LHLDGASAAVQRPDRGFEHPALYDPAVPLMPPGRIHSSSAGMRPDKRYRCSLILAAIRRVLMQDGYNGIAVRRVADASGYSVQTIYNLVGSQSESISEAINEYSRFVVSTAAPQAEDPNALIGIIDGWVQSIQEHPEFCLQSTRVFFTGARHAFHENRQQHIAMLKGLLVRQKKCGVIREDVDVLELADQLIALSSTSCLEWADQCLSIERLRRRLYSGFTSLLADKLERPH